MKNKARKTTPWLSTQVAYGMDCSDPEPSNWRPFGAVADELQARAKAAEQKTAVKGVQPPQ